MTTSIPPNEEEGAIGDAADAIDRGRNERRRLWRRPVCLSPGVRVRVCLGARCDGHPGRPLIGSPWEAAGWMDKWLDGWPSRVFERDIFSFLAEITITPILPMKTEVRPFVLPAC